MTTTTRIGLGLSAALVSLGLAFAPAVFAQDKICLLYTSDAADERIV